MNHLPNWLLISLLYCPIAANAEAEVDLVRETTQSVLEQLSFEKDRLSAEPAYIQRVVRDLIIPHFEFDVMAGLVLDHYWSDMDNSDQACFISGLRDMLVERYAYILLSYDSHQIYYEPSRDIGEIGNRLVRQTITRNGMLPLPVEYAMQRYGEQWKVVDLIVDGVSLIRNYRGMFQSKIHTQGLEYFIQTFPGCSSSR